MTKCTEKGCRSLQTTCQDCGRIVSTAELNATYSGDVVLEKIEEMSNAFRIDFLKIHRTLKYCEDDIKRLNSKMSEMKGSMEYKKRS